jgi:WD40 repeat protein
MPKIVISYRHKDTTAIAGHICDKLRAHYGNESVFMDVSSIRSGVDFRRQIARALHSCDLVVAIIGRKWLGGVSKGSSRIKDEHDFIRIEIETALNSEVPIIPVLVDGASMPKPADLPDSLEQLSYRHASRVEAGRNFHRDMDALIRDMQLLLASEEPASPERKKQRPFLAFVGWAKEAFAGNRGIKASRAKWTAVLSSVLIALVAAAIYAVARPNLPGGRSASPIIKPLITDVKELRSIAVSPDGAVLAVAGDDGVIRLWNPRSFKLEREIPPFQYRAPLPSTGVHKIAFSTTGDRLFSVGFDNKVHIWDILTGRPLSTLDPEPGSSVSILYSLAVFPRKDDDKQWVAAGGNDGCLRVWQIDKQNTPVVSKYVSGDGDRLNKPCDPNTKDKIAAVRSIDFNPQGRGVYATGSSDGSIFFFNEQRQFWRIPAHAGAVFQVVFSPDGERVATAGADRLVKLWRFEERKAITLAGHSNSVSSLAWTRDGGRLLSGSEDRTVRLWDTGAGTELVDPFEGHKKDVQAVAFHPDGKWIISASQDGMLKVWDIDSHRLVLTAIAFEDGTHIVYDRNGIFTGSEGVGRHIIMSSLEDGIERALSESEKNKRYVSPEVFTSRIQANW